MGGVVEKYPEAYRLARNQHNLNIWTFDKAIIGTNFGAWRGVRSTSDEDIDLLQFISHEKDEGSEEVRHLIKLGDFAIFTDFLQKIIGRQKEHGSD